MPFKKREPIPSGPSADEAVLRRGLCVGIFAEPTGDVGMVDLASPDNKVGIPAYLRCADVLLHSRWVPVQEGIEVARLVGMDGYMVRLTRCGECRVILHRFLPSGLVGRVFGERRQ
jgi:hypothetical protein